MFGTSSILDQLALIKNQTAAEYGEQRLANDFQKFLDTQNELVTQITGDLVEDTDVRLTSYGTGVRMTMMMADEYTRVDAQKVLPTSTDLGFPLYLFQISLQWTRKFLQIASVSDLAVQMNAIREADERNIRIQILNALFTPTNNLTYKDRLIDNVTIPLRRLLNADSAPIPEDAFGNTFNAATHTHYLGTASLSAADVESLLQTVVEHGVNGPVYIYINRAQEAAVTGFANFTAYQTPLVSPGPGSTANVADGGPIAPFDYYNRAIGVWDGAAEVWTKPWIPANYILCCNIDPANRILRRRVRPATGNGALTLVAQDEKYPLRAETSEREFGVSVWSRAKAAVLRTNNATYAAPVIS